MIVGQKDSRKPIVRSIEKLQQNYFGIKYRPGKLHSNADGLSRRPCKVECKHCLRLEFEDEIVDFKTLKFEINENLTIKNFAKT